MYFKSYELIFFPLQEQRVCDSGVSLSALKLLTKSVELLISVDRYIIVNDGKQVLKNLQTCGQSSQLAFKKGKISLPNIIFDDFDDYH